MILVSDAGCRRSSPCRSNSTVPLSASMMRAAYLLEAWACAIPGRLKLTRQIAIAASKRKPHCTMTVTPRAVVESVRRHRDPALTPD